ncbi:class I SAM-dependent methyltransferase [Actinophytocola sediminis]
MDQQFWDDMYGGETMLWSGRPNDVLVAEAAGLAAGRALDLGCGEGADALWLAERGWTVTGVDISRVALDRAAKAATAAGLADRVRWTHGDLATTPPPAGAFDLVSAQYFPIPHEPDNATLTGVLAAVAPGGTLLIGGHDLTGHEHNHHPEFDPSQYYDHEELHALLARDWTILTAEIRPRVSPPPPGTEHVNDTVLVARR